MTKTHFKQLVDSDWLGQWDLPHDRDAVVVIESVKRFEPLTRKTITDKRTGQKRLEPSKRLDIAFRGKRKHWLAGPVSQATLQKLYGKYIEEWIGKPIALYVDESVKFGGEVTGGIRVRPRIPNGPASPEPLDNPVDPAKAAPLEEARGQAEERVPGQEG